MNPITTPSLKTTDVGSAIVLRADGFSAMGSGAVSGVKNIWELRNPLQVPMLVDEILFNLSTTTVSGNMYVLNGGDLRVQLRLGTDQITMAYVPVWLLGRSHNLSAQPGYTGTAVANNQFGNTVNQQDNSPIYGMRLSSELILYPGEYIEPTFYNAGNYGVSNVLPRIIVKGRVMPAGTKRQSLPWVSYYVGGLNAAGSNYLEESKESDLCNPFDVPLYVDRMAGMIAGTATGAEVTSADFVCPYGTNECIDAGLNYCLMRMADESGRPMIRDNTPLGHVFQMQSYTWEMKSTIPPHGFYKAYLTENYSNIITTYGATMQAYISLIGKRAVKS